MSFEWLPNWFDRLAGDYVPKYIRGELYPDSTKSRYENTDNNLNIRCSESSGIKKGDMVVDEDANVYVLDWEVSLQANNAPSRALRCNMFLTVERYHEEITDEYGYLIEPEGWSPIFEQLPANAYRYDGRPEYSAISYVPGVIPNALTLMTLQYNDKTKHIRIDDRFIWGNETYTIVDIDYVGIGLDGRGTLKLQAKKSAGGQKLVD